MDFMDLLFERYASPFLLLDGYIQTGRFFDFVDHFIDKTNEDVLFDVWLHKCQDKSFAEFKASVDTNTKTESEEIPSEERLETTIQDTHNILNNFIPIRKG